jgi:hypothetical protein
MKTGCEGCQPGFCKRHNGNKTENMVKLCMTNKEFFDKWENGEGSFAEEGEEFYPIGTVLKNIFKYVGVDRVVEAVVENCNCSEREFKLNHVIRRRNKNDDLPDDADRET